MTDHQPPSLSFLTPPKNSEDCLSYIQIVRVAAGDQTKDRFVAHLATCAMCVERLNAEEQAFAQDKQRDVPPQLLQALRVAQQPPQRWHMPRLLIPSFAVVALAALFVLRTKPADENTLKGGTAILASVRRHGTFILEDRDAQTIKGLQAGDQLSIHVLGKPHLMAYVQVAEDGVWKNYYRGEVPHDGWLPLGLEVTPGGSTQVRIAVCDRAQTNDANVDTMSPVDCQRVALEL